MPAKADSLHMGRNLGLLEVFCISSGSMISSGLFVLPGLLYVDLGPAMLAAYFVAALMVVPALLSKIELSTAMPKAGGDYFFIDRSMGPVAGTLGGLSAWFSLSLKSAFALVGIGAFLVLIHPGISPVMIKIAASAACILFVIMNVFSVKHTGRAQNIMVLSLLGLLVLYILAGMRHVDSGNFTPFYHPFNLDEAKKIPLAVLAGAGTVFISFGGLTKVAAVAEEVRNPQRDIPVGMLMSFFIVTALYIAVIWVTVGVVEPSKLYAGGKGTMMPVSLGAEISMGRAGMVLLAIGALLAFASTANAGILSASRAPMAMSRDNLLPGIFNRFSANGIPVFSVLITGLFMLAAIWLLDIRNLVKVASTLKIMLFAFVNLAVIVMRESHIGNYRPSFRVPLYPWLNVGGLIGSGFLIVDMGTVPLLATGAFFAVGLLWYMTYSRFRVKRESAMMHVIGRITAKEMTGQGLQWELREIIRGRDNIVEDRFDRIIDTCPVADLDESMNADEFFHVAAEQMQHRLQLAPDMIFEKLASREADSTTVLRDGLAVPHIMVPGPGRFELFLARSRNGIFFPGKEQPVHTAFVIAGSMDERNFHLRTLMYIAQITQDMSFDIEWAKARTARDLRDIILLAKRRRGTGSTLPPVP